MDSVDFSLDVDWSTGDNVDTGVVDYANDCAASHDVGVYWVGHFGCLRLGEVRLR